jgi:hypothetical protein
MGFQVLFREMYINHSPLSTKAGFQPDDKSGQQQHQEK